MHILFQCRGLYHDVVSCLVLIQSTYNSTITLSSVHQHSTLTAHGHPVYTNIGLTNWLFYLIDLFNSKTSQLTVC